MDLMHEWLGTTVERDFRQVLEWQDRHGYVNGDPTQELSIPRDGQWSSAKAGAITFREDGSNLRIRSTELKVVQIIKFEKFEDPSQPIEAQLSDSITRVIAKIDKIAAQRYSDQTKKRFTDGTLGGLIQLLDFEIVVTHLGPRPHRITLWIDNFKSLGSNGSGVFGDAPSAIESRAGIAGLLQKFVVSRTRDTTRGQALSVHNSSGKNSPLTQIDHALPIDEGLQLSQGTFATQAPLLPKPHIEGVDPRQLRTNIETASTTGPQNSKTSDISPVPKLNGIERTTPLNSISHNSDVHPNPQISVYQSKKSPAINEDLWRLLEKPKSRQIPNAVPRTDENRQQVHLKAPERTSAPKSMTIRHSAKSSADIVAVNQRSSASCPHSPTETSYVVHTESRVQSPSGDAAKRPSETGNCSAIRAPLRGRISNKEIEISRKQEELLSQVNSWRPPKDLVANIPISTLEELNRDADLRAIKSSSLRAKGTPSDSLAVQLKHPGTGLRNGIDQETLSSDSEIELSSSQWPLSPERNQLPPDSDMASPNHSSTSGLSRNLMSASSGMASPSIISTSTGEESKRFKCTALGCNRLYGKEASLKYHMRKHHNNAVVPKTFACTIERCIHAYSSNRALQSHVKKYHDSKGSLAIEPDHSASSHIQNVNQNGSTRDDVADSADMETHHTVLTPASLGSLVSRPGSQQQMDLNPATILVPSTRTTISTNTNAVHNSTDMPSMSQTETICPDSDLEMTVPTPLNVNANPSISHALGQQLPATASLSNEPFTQVKHTPTISDQLQKIVPHQSNPPSSPLQPKSGASSNVTPLKDVSHVPVSLPSTMDLDNMSLSKDKSIEESAGSLVELSVGLSATEKDHSTDPGRNKKIESSQITRKMPQTPIEQKASAFNNVDSSILSPSPLKSPTTLNGSGTSTIEDSSYENRDRKRRAPSDRILSPNVAQRRKRLKTPVDPLEGARQIRLDFLASRRVSGSTTPTKSPMVEPQTALPNRDDPKAEAVTVNPSSRMEDFVIVNEDTGELVNAGASSAPDQREPGLGTIDLSGLDLHKSMNSKETLHLSDDDLEPVKAGAQELEFVRSGINLPTEPHPLLPNADPNLREVDERPGLPIMHPSPLPGQSLLSDPSMEIDKSFEQNQEQNMSLSSSSMAMPLHCAEIACNGEQSRELTDLPIAGGENIPQAQQPRSFEAQTWVSEKVPFSEEISVISSAQSASKGQAQQPPTVDHISSADALLANSKKQPPESVSYKPLVVEGANLLTEVSLFERFKGIYPEYSGDLKHFTALCKKITSLLKINQMQYQALWDDFIIRHRIDYAEHLRRCAESGDVLDVQSYEEFYRDEIEEPQFVKRVVTRRNLQEILLLAGETSDQASETHYTSAITSQVSSPEKNKVQHIEDISSLTSNAPAKSITIDLTQDDEPVDRRVTQPPSLQDRSAKTRRKSSRPLPWLDQSGSDFKTTQDSPNILQSHPRRRSAETGKPSGSNRIEPSPADLAATLEEVFGNSERAQWQENGDTPFKKFLRDYASVRPGNGNAFAKSSEAKPQDGQRRKKRKKGYEPRNVDVWSWQI